MLPDFPKLKKKIQNIHRRTINDRISMYMGHLSDIAEISIPEGDKFIIIQEDGSVEESNFEQIKSEKIMINHEEIGKMTPNDLMHKYDDLARSFASSKSKMMYERITDAVGKVGNVSDAKGKPFTIEDFFWSIEKIQIDFDENGEPEMPMIMIDPDIEESVAKAMSELEKNPENKRRFNEIIERKRGEWRVRESNRKLVG
jgi:hypothetical protein